ncbi:tRNA-dihydrouridine(47) synthase [NAD(P)(+)]-like [Sesamum alatum]|uniref:tRNA-dihydrouridine(47) synthase [NAD(P)(+)] n=1 Tax=Sesamum alatum TaxID=300844 RepID=A0AAE1YXR1_9LAMI|nr:tRNA-dihydrouridine(47) synthase [NAD(P)(+)]-like [Sesamum alatum]
MGCQLISLSTKGAGSAFLPNQCEWKSVVEASSRAVDIPVTIKVRTGYFEGKNRIDSLIADIGNWGATAVTIHGRDTTQRYSKNLLIGTTSTSVHEQLHLVCKVLGMELRHQTLLAGMALVITFRYIPVGLLDVVPQRINWRPPSYFGRDDLETLMASDSAADWIRISEMLLGKVPSGFTFCSQALSSKRIMIEQKMAK